jgi:Fe-S oxidoreductase/nitrate reductase gamma subunit
MYACLVISMAILAWGLFKKYKFVVGDKGAKSLYPDGLHFGSFFNTIFFQGKVKREKFVGIFHSLLFYGFWILFIATDLVKIHTDTPFKVFQGTTYIVISFLADFSGVAILIGLAMAYYRRYVKKPEYLSSTKPNNEKFMYAMIALLVILGFVLEGFRILGTGMPPGEQYWAPFGWILAKIFSSLNLTEEALTTVYRGTWMVHMLNTFAFIASIGHTKFFHLFAIPISALVTPKRRGAVLKPMDFEDETAETFGLGKLSEMTSKNKLDLLSCVECGRCTQVCPANLSDKPLDPKTIVTKARDLADSKPGENVDFWENSTFSSAELDACTTCGACMEECPANIEHVDIILNLKRYKALTLGEIPPSAADAINKIKVNGNPWGITQDERFKWADGLEVPEIEAGKHVDYLYYVGCAGSYDDSNQKVVQDTVKLLKQAGVSFAVMGKTEKCNGDPIRRFGDEYSFFEVAIENIENMNKYDFDKVVTHCPHCLHTIGKEYAKFDNGDFTTIHHTELLADLVKTGQLTPKKTISETVSYHDPCYLGRHHGEYDAPREILKSIPGLKVNEMEKNKDKAQCCGMGGGNMWYELPDGFDPIKNRLEDIAETKAPKLATACSFCMINFKSSKGLNENTEDLEVEDIAQILAKSVLD